MIASLVEIYRNGTTAFRYPIGVISEGEPVNSINLFLILSFFFFSGLSLEARQCLTDTERSSGKVNEFMNNASN